MCQKNRFNTYKVLVFSDFNKTQVFKMLFRDCLLNGFELPLSSSYLNVFEMNKHTQDYHIREPINGNFLFEIEDKKYVFVGNEVITFETNDILVKKIVTLRF